MASNKEFVEYVAEQMQDAGIITYRRMFGEYGIYCNGKIIAFICDNQLLLKATEAGREVCPDLPMGALYEGAQKKYFLVEDVDNREMLNRLIPATYEALPESKPKRGTL